MDFIYLFQIAGSNILTAYTGLSERQNKLALVETEIVLLYVSQIKNINQSELHKGIFHFKCYHYTADVLAVLWYF